MPASLVPLTASPGSVKLSTYDGKTNWEVYKIQFSIISEANGWTEGVKACQLAASLRGEASERKTRLQKTGKSLQEYASEVESLANLAFSNHPATVRETTSLQSFVDDLREGEVQKAVRMVDVQDLKSALLYALKLEAATQASRRNSQSIQGARVTLDAPCESPWQSDIEKLRDEFQDLMAQQDPCRTNVTESKKVCSNRKGSADENGDVRLKRPCSESCKNLSNSLRVEKKFGVIDPVVRQVTTPSTLALDPWSDESVRKDQLADTNIKPIIEFKESSEEKPGWQDIAPFHPTTKRYWALWNSLHLRNGPRKRTRGRLQLYNAGAPIERIAFDILGPLARSSDGNNNILVVMDYFTKWPEAYPIPDQEASTVAEVLVRHWISRFGVPLQLHSDQGRNFRFCSLQETV
ncbi:uncharacterized protein TNCV_3124741 [Trichonephila clavipes]|nr:uncharacterized protein TNCV_3124741 [Trichonephila clavipes]